LLLLTALAAGLRFWGLDRIPPGFHYDEAYEALEAWRVLTQPGYHPIFFPGNFGVEPLFIYLTSLAFRLFGETPAVMRGVAALLGTLTVPAVYALGRELVRADDRIPPATPLLAAAALAIMRWHIHYSRVGIEPVLVPLLWALLLWGFWHGLRTGRAVGWAMMGAAAALGPYAYPAGRMLPVVAVALAGVALVGDRSRLRGRWRGLLAAGVLAVLIFAPLALHWARHPDQLLLRSSQIAVGAGAATPTGPLDHLLATLAMFNLHGDVDPRNNAPGMPVLDVLMSAPFLIGVGVALWRWRRPAFAGLLAAGALMLVPTIFSEYAPHFRRALGAAPAVALLCGLGLAILLGRRSEQPATPPQAIPPRLRQNGAVPEEIAAGMDALRRVGRVIVVAVILLGSGVYTATVYFSAWGRSHAIYYAYDQGLWEIGQYVLGLPASERVYLTPRPPGDMTLAFAWRNGPAVRHFDGRSAFVAPAFTPDLATYIVIEHEDFRGGRLLRELYPQAAEVKTFLDRDGKVYARAYRTPKTPIANTQIPHTARQPKYPVSAAWPGMALIGYDLDAATYRPGQIVYLQLWWRATAAGQTDWTVFTHLLGAPRADGRTVWAGRDARPGQGSAPTTAWQPGDLILDEYPIQLPPDIPAGEYQIEVGIYDPARGGARGITSTPAGADHLILGKAQVR
jgi:4-amino-4-deoxy-L-arabinose transferase-like glycosyltransferase